MNKNNFSEQNKQTETSTKINTFSKKGAIAHKLNIKPIEHSPFFLKIASTLFLIHWFIGAIAGLLYQHFAPMKDEYSQFITILCSSLFTFTVSIVSFIELTKTKRSGISITVTLAWANVVVQLLVLYYAKFWLILFNNLFFAFAITLLLKGKSRVLKNAICILLVLLNYGLYIAPAIFYAVQRSRAPMLLQEVNELRKEILQTAVPIDPKEVNRYIDRIEFKQSQEYVETLEKAENAYRQLTIMSDFIGEKQLKRAIFYSNWAMTLALKGDYKFAYEIASNAVTFAYVEEAYQNKAKVFAILHNIPYKKYEIKILSEQDEHLIEQRRREDRFGNVLDDDPTDDEFDLDNWLGED